jgi:hypothetical protein
MEVDNLNLLKNIKRIEVSDALLENITHRIQLINEDRIPYYKVSVAATIIVAAIDCSNIFHRKFFNIQL